MTDLTNTQILMNKLEQVTEKSSCKTDEEKQLFKINFLLSTLVNIRGFENVDFLFDTMIEGLD